MRYSRWSSALLKDVVEVQALAPYRFRVRFEDGVEGIVALDEIVKFEGVFAPLREPDEFRNIGVHPEWGVVCWPSGADLDSDMLYAQVTHSPVRVKTTA